MTGQEDSKASPDPISRSELALLCVVSYGVECTPADLPEFATNEFYSLAGPTTVEQCQQAFASCLAKDWLQIINAASLDEITKELNQDQLLGPIYGLPGIGIVGFTSEGAKVWLDRYPARRDFAYTDVVHSKTSRYFRDKQQALCHIAEITASDSSTSVTGPFAIGPWRVQWWRRYDSGFRIDIEKKGKWTGVCSGGVFWHTLGHPDQTSLNPERLLRILENHNVRLSEWLVLTTVDDVEIRGAEAVVKSSARMSRRRFGVVVSEDECRNGLNACFQHGWLRLVDEMVAAELQSFLRNAPEAKPLYENDGILSMPLNAVDYSAEGAVLYQVIATEYFGHDWDSQIGLSRECYRKENRYCQTEEGIAEALADYNARSERVETYKIVPLGSWCVHWWQVFFSGFMLEVEIGTR